VSSYAFYSISATISFIPIITGMAFNSEHKMVKREIAVNTYSITSYYFSVLLFEYLRCLPFMIIFMIGSKIIIGQMVDLMIMFIYFLMFTTLIVAYLFYGSVLRGTKKVILVYGLFIIFNNAQFCPIIASMRKDENLSKIFMISYLLNLCPNYVLGVCPHIHAFTKMKDRYAKLVDENGINLYKLLVADTREELMKQFKSLLVGYEIPIVFNYLTCVVLIIVYMLLCILMLSFHLQAGYRIRLNKK
ncbi:putative transporter, partial [Trachipleistophora hominis]